MIAVDTNVLIRFFLDDHKDQAKKVKHLFETTHANNDRIYVSTIVLAEATWVLTNAYRFNRDMLIAWLEDVLNAAFISVEHENDVETALTSFKAGKGNFSDYLIAVHAKRHTKGQLYTFDKACKEPDLFRAPTHPERH